MQSSARTQPDEAAQLLESVRAARETADRRVAVNWFPRVVFGSLLLVSSYVFGIWDGAAVVLFWLIATPVALVAIKRHRRRQLRESGAVRDLRPYLVVTGSFIVASIACGAAGGALGEQAVVDTGPTVALAAVLAFIAARDRSAGFAWSAVAVTAIAIFVVLADIEGTARALAIGIGGGLALDAWRERSKAPE